MAAMTDVTSALSAAVTTDGTITTVLGDEVCRVSDDGSLHFYDADGLLGRVHGPAVVYADGEVDYYRHGLLHRADGPAQITPCGRVAYYVSGMLHRADGPAVLHADGSQEYWLYGEHVRTDQGLTVAAVGADPALLLAAG